MTATENKESSEKMNVYEIGYLIATTIPEDKVTAEVAFIQNVIQTAGGLIIVEEFPKLKPLSYQITKTSETKKQKFNDAYFGWIKFEMTVANIVQIEKEIKNRDSIIRFLLIKTIRENTMHGLKFFGQKRLSENLTPKIDSLEPVQEKKPVSQEEIDKSIDALVIS